MTQAIAFTAALVATAVLTGASYAETVVKTGKTASGDTCSVTVEKRSDGSIAAAGSSSTSGSSGISSSSSAGGSSVHVQAGGGNVSSSSSTSGGPGSVSSSASTITVNGCTVSTSSP